MRVLAFFPLFSPPSRLHSFLIRKIITSVIRLPESFRALPQTFRDHVCDIRLVILTHTPLFLEFEPACHQFTSPALVCLPARIRRNLLTDLGTSIFVTGDLYPFAFPPFQRVLPEPFP